jgi:hypothetical protein
MEKDEEVFQFNPKTDDVHCAAGLLKVGGHTGILSETKLTLFQMYLRELPEPIFRVSQAERAQYTQDRGMQSWILFPSLYLQDSDRSAFGESCGVSSSQDPSTSTYPSSNAQGTLGASCQNYPSSSAKSDGCEEFGCRFWTCCPWRRTTPARCECVEPR